MRLLKKTNGALALLLASALLCASCRHAGTAEKTAVSFSWWGTDARAEYTLNGIGLFEKQHPELSIEPEYAPWSGYEEAFAQAYRDGTAADVMQINFDWLYRYSPDGDGFYDLGTLGAEIELYNVTKDDLAYGTMGGKLNAIPIAFNTIIPVFDKATLERDGLSVPGTWDELFRCAEAYRRNSREDRWLLGASAKHAFLLALAWFEQTHAKKAFADNETLSLSAEETGELLDFARSLIDAHVLRPVPDFSPQSLDGTLAGALCWCNETSSYARVFDDRGGNGVLGSFIKAPGATESGWYQKPVVMYAINKDCKDPKAAATFLDFLLNNPDMALLQQCEKGVPVSNKSLSALMEQGGLGSMQYAALMKMRFNDPGINRMLPVMENKNLNEAFVTTVLAYAAGRLPREEAVSALIQMPGEPANHGQGS